MCALAWWTLETQVNVAAVQETHFTCAIDCRVLEDDYVVLSAYGCRNGVEVSLLIGRSLNADVNHVLADDGGRLIMVDVAVKNFEFRVAVVYVPNIAAEKLSFYRRLAPFPIIWKGYFLKMIGKRSLITR